MKPEEGKWYKIDCKNTRHPSLSFKGLGKCMGKESRTDNGKILYRFKVIEVGDGWGYFSEESIKEEVKETR